LASPPQPHQLLFLLVRVLCLAPQTPLRWLRRRQQRQSQGRKRFAWWKCRAWRTSTHILWAADAPCPLFKSSKTGKAVAFITIIE
jgi:hypothetical protein